MALNSTTPTRSFSKSQLDHVPAAMIPSPTESYISDEVHSNTLDVDDMVVTPSVDLSQEEEKNRFPWLNVRNPDECDGAERKFKNYINDVILAPYGHVKRYPKIFYLADLYYDKYGLIQYSECFALIEEGKKSLDYFWTVIDLINNVTQGNIVAMNNLTSLVNTFQFPKSVDNFDGRLQNFCGWREFFVIWCKQSLNMP